VDRFAGHVGIARNHEEFLERIEEALATETEEKRRGRQALVAKMSWEATVAAAWSTVAARMNEQETQSSVGVAGVAGVA
jgi:hypothetical protein